MLRLKAPTAEPFTERVFRVNDCDYDSCGPESWRPVVGFEGDYSVSDHGRIASHFTNPPRIRVTGLGQTGYPRVTLAASGAVYHKNVHALVLHAFVGPRPEELVTRHLNGDRTNNHLSNLAYGTISENMLDKVVHGTHHEVNKTHCPSGHPYNELNTYFRPGTNKRKCRTCNRERARALRANLRAAA